MSQLVIPNLEADQVGQVQVTIEVANRIDQVLAQRGLLPSEEVRRETLDKVIVDTGATLLSLPTAIIQRLGLVAGETATVETSAGVREKPNFSRCGSLC